MSRSVSLWRRISVIVVVVRAAVVIVATKLDELGYLCSHTLLLG